MRSVTAILLLVVATFTQNVNADLDPEVQQILQAIQATLTQLGQDEGMQGADLAGATSNIASSIQAYLGQKEVVVNILDLSDLLMATVPGDFSVDEALNDENQLVLVADLGTALHMFDSLAQLLAEVDESEGLQTLLVALQLVAETIAEAAEKMGQVHYNPQSNTNTVKRGFLDIHIGKRDDGEDTDKKRDFLDVHIHGKRDDAEQDEKKRDFLDVHFHGKRDDAEKKRDFLDVHIHGKRGDAEQDEKKRDFLDVHFHGKRDDAEKKRDFLDVHIHGKRDDAEQDEKKRDFLDVHFHGKRDDAEKKRDFLDVHIHGKRDDAEQDEKKRDFLDVHIHGKRKDSAEERDDSKRLIGFYYHPV